MPDRTVQVAEARTIVQALGQQVIDLMGDEDVTERVQADLASVDAVLALLSQPTPTAEPPRIEDLAPGKLPCADPNVNRWYCQRGADGTCPLPKCIDPSTIRDVTPPAVTT